MSVEYVAGCCCFYWLLRQFLNRHIECYMPLRNVIQRTNAPMCIYIYFMWRWWGGAAVATAVTANNRSIFLDYRHRCLLIYNLAFLLQYLTAIWWCPTRLNRQIVRPRDSIDISLPYTRISSIFFLFYLFPNSIGIIFRFCKIPLKHRHKFIVYIYR